jgi:hypothetical protein
MKNTHFPKTHQGKEKAPSAATLEGSKSTLTMQPKYANVNTPTSKKRKPRKWHETATAAQYATIIENLTPCGKRMHTHALRRLGVMAVAARTKELRERYGFPLYRVGLVTIYDDWGFAHRNVAMYALICPNDKHKPL